MHTNLFIRDMAIIMLTAGIVSIIFHRLKQPVVLGYLVAGIIIGPHTLLLNFIKDQQSISTLAELGIVFLMFSLGLEFSLKKIAKVGPRAIITALIETSIMLFLGFNLGKAFNFSDINALFLGATIAISSTTIIVKALGELGLKQHKFAHLIFGILIVEDILAIGIIAILSGIATGKNIDGDNIVGILGQLSLFIIISLTIGLLLIPRLINYIASYRTNEMLLVSVLGFCFLFCLIVSALDYSIALGAFIIGAIVAESNAVTLIERLIEPLKDMFCAIFFVAIGMMFDPNILFTNLSSLLLISGTLIIGKIFGVSLGSFLTGETPRTAFRTGMGLAQIGELSFVIALMGVNLKVTNVDLYPTVIAVSAITTLLTPYLIRYSDSIINKISQYIPSKPKSWLNKYTNWCYQQKPQNEKALIIGLISKIIAQIIVNCALVYAVFIAGVFVALHINHGVLGLLGIKLNQNLHKSIICGLALLVSLPFLIATYRKLKALGMILAEFIIQDRRFGEYTYSLRRIIFETTPIIIIIAIMSLIFSVSISVIPSPGALSIISVLGLIIAIIFKKPMIKFQSWLQIELFKVLNEKKN